MGSIVVIGSINMDLVCRTARMPEAGETILGSDFVTIPGGKGANQAVAAAKLGGDVHMVGRVGSDDFGQRMLTGMRGHGVNVDHVTITEGVASGVAMILVNKAGENSIVVAPGANHRLTIADIEKAEEKIKKASVVVMQLEIPVEVVRHAVAMCQRLKVMTILDPAPVPAKGLPRALYGVDVFTPNQTEAELLLGLERVRVKKKRTLDPKQIGTELLARGPGSVLLKLGAKGSMLVERNGEFTAVRPFRVKVVDTTAAGDAFTGALAVARAEGQSMEDAMRFANAAGALCCQGFGAQPSLPTRKQVDELLG
ncbi:MAG TPA: ribokinase [Tepidisphaeraceae bacterium]|jgi:ribokinase|nr:ribokinase [Tepidisphaeraceae bacterium]